MTALPATLENRVPRSGKKRRVAGLIAVIVVVGILAVLALGAIGFVQAKSVADHSKAAATAASQMVRNLSADPAAAKHDLETMQDEVTSARQSLSQIPLAQAAAIPNLGRNLDAVESLLAQLDSVAKDAAPTFVQAATYIDLKTKSLRDDGSPLLERIGKVTDTVGDLAGAIDVLERARTAVANINTNGLLSQVASAVTQAKSSLDTAVTTVAPFKDIAETVQGGKSAIDVLRSIFS